MKGRFTAAFHGCRYHVPSSLSLASEGLRPIGCPVDIHRTSRGEVFYLFNANATFTAQATVQPTIGLLPMPRKPIISTCAGTELEPAN